MKKQDKDIGITKIYLVENCFGDPNKVYIGKTKNCRKKAHMKTFGNLIEYNYIDKVNSLNRKDWEPLESYWIEQFRHWGFKVLNIRKKGGGGPEYKTLESREKQSQSMIGRKQSEEHRNKLSKIRKGMIRNQQTIQNLKDSKQNNLNMRRDDNTKKKIGDSHKGKPKLKLQKSIEKYSLEGTLLETYTKVTEAIKIYKGIPAVLSGRTKTCGGFIWKYKEN